MGLSMMDGWFNKKSQNILKGGEAGAVFGGSDGGGDWFSGSGSFALGLVLYL